MLIRFRISPVHQIHGSAGAHQPTQKRAFRFEVENIWAIDQCVDDEQWRFVAVGLLGGVGPEASRVHLKHILELGTALGPGRDGVQVLRPCREFSRKVEHLCHHARINISAHQGYPQPDHRRPETVRSAR